VFDKDCTAAAVGSPAPLQSVQQQTGRQTSMARKRHRKTCRHVWRARAFHYL